VAAAEERWERADRLLDEALDRPANERAAFLDEACAGDRDLRGLLERLLADQETGLLAPGGALAGPLGAGLAEELLADAPEREGAVVGRYRILRELGRGGMAVVYLAERADGEFEQRVALKLLRRGVDTGEVLRQFRQERQILALARHPNIARLLDAGASADGRPYVIMEHVQGRPIDRYCDERGLDTAERLRLFLQVARAVEHAHRNLVVHRDIKPSNILVSDEGEVKLLDFGIAKLLDPDDPDATLTRTRVRFFTPGWASPEQVKGAPVTTSSDVYQLGLLLYRLLTGRLPFASELRGEELARAVCDEAPLRPSLAARDGGRGRDLRGDLDNILLVALRKEPERRFPDVRHFVEDVERYLAGYPVSARADSAAYRAGKFVRRHWLLVATSSLAALSLGAGLLAASWQARRAERRFQEVRRLSRAVLFDLHDQIAALPGSTRARETLVTTSLQYLDGLAREAGRDPDLLWELAGAYERVGDVLGHPRAPNLGQLDDAYGHYGRALELVRSLAGRARDEPRFRRAVGRLNVKRGELEERSGQHAVALRSLRAALDDARVLNAGSDRAEEDFALLVDALVAVGQAQLRANDVGAALESLEEALAVAERWASEHPGDKARRALGLALASAGDARAEKGELDRGLESYRLALAVSEDLARRNPHDATYQRDLRVLHNWLGNVLGGPGFVNLGDRTAARRHYDEALRVTQRLADADPGDARAQVDLAIAHWKLGALLAEDDPGRGEPLLSRGLELTGSILAAAPLRFDVQRWRVVIQLTLADALVKLGRRDGARGILREALAAAEDLHRRRPADTEARGVLRSALRRAGDFQLADGDLVAAAATLERARGLAEAWATDKPGDIYAFWALADTYTSLGRLHAALAAGDGSAEARREAARRAREWHSKALAVWDGWPPAATSTAFHTAHRAQAARELGEVERRLEALGGDVER
jgi:tetratricopeptide (TPR) repeat protein